MTCTVATNKCYHTCGFTVGYPETHPIDCDENTEVLVQLSVHDSYGCGDWHQEISWIIDLDSDEHLAGSAPYDTKICMPKNGAYKIHMMDSWGDGWHGNRIELTRLDTSEVVANCTVEFGAYSSCEFEIGETSIDSSAYVPFIVRNIQSFFASQNEAKISRAIQRGFKNYARDSAMIFVDESTQNQASFSCTTPSVVIADNNAVDVTVLMQWSSADVRSINWGRDLDLLSANIR